MTRLILQPAGGAGIKNYSKTIENHVDLKKLKFDLHYDDLKILEKEYPDGKCYIWGNTKSDLTKSHWAQISKNDITIFTRNKRAISVGTVCHKIQNRGLALMLWGLKRNAEGEAYRKTYKYIYFLKDISPLDFSYEEVNKAIGYDLLYNHQGWRLLDVQKSADGIENLKLDKKQAIDLFSSVEIDKWNLSELEMSVKFYIEMLEKDKAQEPYKKIDYYKKLNEKFPYRTIKAFERRMGNISHIYSEAGRRHLKGLKPLSHVGTNVARKLEDLISKYENRSIGNYASFNAQVKSNKPKKKPSGSKNPNKHHNRTTQYERDPKVVAWVLNNSNYICECCSKDSPFVKNDGTKYMEVHHLRRLADGGSDTIENCVAICPNCHRELHFGVNSKKLLDTIYSTVSRLIRE